MTDSCEPEVVLPCEGNCESILQELYINLCNLIVESRIPGVNERGYGDGRHCPPLLGSNTHKCDLSVLECQKHQRLIHHLLQAVECNIFEIEVLMLPDCCAEPKLKDRIQNKEYLLLERWSMNCINSKKQPNIEISQLLRAVRSFLHFSQISAWLSSTKGKSPANIYYWIKPSIDGSAINFEREPEVHSFPICKISDDLYGCVTVKYPTRTRYVPIIPCSKHPPIRGYSFRTINEDTSLCANIPLNPQIVRQLQLTCDTTQSTPTVKNYSPEPATLVLNPASLLKTLSSKVSDGNKSNRVLKHSNCQTDLIKSSDLTLDISKSKNIDVISKSQTAFVVCNYTETCSTVRSQENVCFDKRELAMHLRKAGLKFRKLNAHVSSPPGYEIISDSLQPSSDVHNHTVENVSSIEECDVSQVSNSQSVASKNSSGLQNIVTSPYKEVKSGKSIIRDHCKHVKIKKKYSFKRKRTDINVDKMSILPHKKARCDTNISSQLFNASSPELNQKTLTLFQNIATSHIKTMIPTLTSHATNSELVKDCPRACTNDNVSHKNRASDIEHNFKKKDHNISKYLHPSKMTTAKEKRVEHRGILNTQCSQKHVRKRKSQQEFVEAVKHKYKLYFSCHNYLERKESKKKSKEVITTKKSAANECKYSLSVNSVLPSTINPVPINKEKTHLNFSETKNKISSQINLSNLEDNGRYDCTFHQGSSTSESISMCKSVERTCHPKHKFLQTNELPELAYQSQILRSSGGSGVCMKKRSLLYQKKRNNYLNAISSTLESKSLPFGENAPQKSSLIKEDKFRKKIKKSLIESSKVISEGNIRGESSSSYENSNRQSSYCSRSRDLEHSKKEKDGNADLTCDKTKSIGNSINNTQKKGCKRRSETELATFVSKQLKTNELSKVRNKPYKPPAPSNRRIKDKNYQKCGVRRMYNPKSINSETLISEKILIDSPSAIFPEVESKFDLPKTECLNISEVTDINNSEDQTQTLSQKILNEDRNISSSISKPVLLSLPDGKLSTSASYRSFNAYRTLYQTNENLECFPTCTTKFPKGRKLLVNFEESILLGCLPTVNRVKGFHAEIGASGSFCPNHLTLPADVHFYELGNSNQGAAPYVAHITLGDAEYYLPKKGAVQVTLFNPSETVVKMFVLNYDLSDMPPLCHTFIRQKIYYLPVGSKEDPSCQRWLRFIIHLRFASTKSGKIFLHKDFKIVVLNKSNDDAASEFSQEPRELRSFLSVPMNPTYSSI